jgi:hypothetical protein
MRREERQFKNRASTAIGVNAVDEVFCSFVSPSGRLCEITGIRSRLAPRRRRPTGYERAAVRWHIRFLQETKNVDLRESLAVLALLATIPANRLAATALAELLGRRRSCELIAEALARWSRAA